MAGSLHPSAAGDDAAAEARRAALARAEEAEAEAVAAAIERDAATARVRAALERAAAAPEDAEEDASSLSDGSRPSVHAAMVLQEAAAVLNLHAQAVAVQNIRSLVHVILDVNSGNFARWREQFLLTLGKYSLQGHVLHDDCPLNSPDWERMDCVVRSWLYGTLSDNLLDIIRHRGDQGVTARTIWLAIESQFLGNREARALILDAKLSVTDYCKLLKTTAYNLADLGEPVSDRSLVLNLIRGLNERFASVGRHLRRGRPFPSFLEACDELILEELTMGSLTLSPPTALVAGTGGGFSSSRPAYQQPSGHPTNKGGGLGGKGSGRGARGKGGKGSNRSSKGGGSGTSAPPNQGASGPRVTPKNSRTRIFKLNVY